MSTKRLKRSVYVCLVRATSESNDIKMSFQEKKQYGLLMPKKKELGIKKSNVFGDDSDEEDPHAAVNTDIKKQALQAKVKRQTQLEIDKALEADPTVYDYDSIYDSMKAEKEEKNAAVKQKADKKPRYIQGLLKAAENRKREDERRQERKVQKEREKEGGEFDDKEVFITGAYKKKMQEMQELEEKERREAEMEAMLDVKKQKDMTGFYRYLLRETAGESQTGESQTGESQSGEVIVKLEREESRERTESGRDLKQNESSSSDSSDSEEKRREDSRSRSKKDKSDSRERNRYKDEGAKTRKRSRSKDRKDDHRRRGRSRSHERQQSRRRSRSRERKRSRSRDRDSDRNRSKATKEDRYSKKDWTKERSSAEMNRSRKRDSDEMIEDKPKRKREKEEEKEEEEILPQPPPNLERDRSEEKEGLVLPQPPGPESSVKKTEGKYVKKTSESEADAARRRYLERKLAKEKARNIQREETG